jgi:4-hydroxybenzoate polyprenyltransferase
MVDRDDDLAVGIKSTAILFGRHDVSIIAALMAAMLALLVSVGLRVGLTWPWYGGVLVSAALFGRQLFLIRGRERQACFRAFLNNNWVGFSLFLGLVAHYVLGGALTG